jgi:preprotein translocase subunit SecE
VTDFRGEPSPKRIRWVGLIPYRLGSEYLFGEVLCVDQMELLMAKVSPFKFLQEVRAEMQKVTWPSRRETGITTLMVFIMSAAAAVFFLVADQLIRLAVTTVLGIL